MVDELIMDHPNQPTTQDAIIITPLLSKTLLIILQNHLRCVQKSEDGVTRAVYKYCQKKYLVDSKGHGTSNLLSYLTFSKKDGDEGVNLVATSFSVEAIRKALTEMIVLDELPFRFIKGKGFKRFCAVLQPKFKNILPRGTITTQNLNYMCLTARFINNDWKL
ncbi:hypothetical protein CsSME_00043812 [Camellia sinensis var. sinensis]